MGLGFGSVPSVFSQPQYGADMGQTPLSYGMGGFGTTAPTAVAPPPVAPVMAPKPPMGVTPMGTPMGPPSPTGAQTGMQDWSNRTQVGQMFHNQDGTFNWGAVGSAAQAIGGLGQLYLGFQANKQAQEEFQYMKGITDKNMANQIKDFNKAVEDQSYARAAQNNSASGTAEAYIEKHRL